MTSAVAIDERRAVVVGTEVVDSFPVIEQALVLVTAGGRATWERVRLGREVATLTAVVGVR